MIDRKVNIFMVIIFLVAFGCFLGILLLNQAKEKEEVYIQRKPQVTKVIKKNDEVYIDVYNAPCKDNELTECIYIRIYPNKIEELDRNERSETNDSLEKRP